MNYYYDCEFLEGTQDKKILGIKVGQTKPTIDLISIGIISEDGREYYAISKDFNLRDAWNRYDLKINKHYPLGPEYIKEYWIRENVLRPIWEEYYIKTFGCNMPKFSYESMKAIIEKNGKPNKQIAEEICNFIDERFSNGKDDSNGFIYAGDTSVKEVKTTNLKFYGYYSAYDHVVLCWLFGKMIDLPKGFPMYTIDLKQMLDEKEMARQDCTDMVELRNLPTYPKQTKEHNALTDAKWNKELHTFIKSL